ncbi:MAG: tripartite tricarboxylate transporter substrate binding protein [Burkholderiales bacterium]|jgi:tripartite-type tricarboxylate transporter receptor subunit TctC|nr:tripartite tricarboxylate transporter substrate binding protein [Burkholderiales bacterium]
MTQKSPILKLPIAGLSMLAAATLLVLAPGAATAQQYPNKPVRFIIPFPPGGPTDIMGRLAADILAKGTGQQFVPDNRGGAGGNIGAELCAKAPPDGYTICMITAAQGVSPAIYRKMSYDPARDLATITLMANLPSLLTVHPALPVKTVGDLLALAKSKPGALSYASTGNGSSPHMLMEMFKFMTGTKMVHVPYKGQAPAVVDQLSGQVQLAFNTAISVMPQVEAGRLRAVAISSKDRFPPMPNLPTVEEGGVKGFDGGSWQGVGAPAGTPADIIRRLNTLLVTELKTPAMREQLLKRGGLVSANSPEEFSAYLKAEIARWTKIARAANITID